MRFTLYSMMYIPGPRNIRSSLHIVFRFLRGFYAWTTSSSRLLQFATTFARELLVVMFPFRSSTRTHTHTHTEPRRRVGESNDGE